MTAAATAAAIASAGRFAATAGAGGDKRGKFLGKFP
jgi:hypothetical protein